MIAHQRNWGEDRVFYYDANGRLKSFLANITDLCPSDAFGRVSAGRSAFRLDDLLELRELLDRHNGTAGDEQECVKENSPQYVKAITSYKGLVEPDLSSSSPD